MDIACTLAATDLAAQAAAWRRLIARAGNGREETLTDGGDVVLDVASPGEGVAALHSMLTSAPA